MRHPDHLECLYLDFDGFFASVLQQANPRLRNRPIGVIPFDTQATERMTMIACSKEAKRLGVENVMSVPEALQRCPELVLVPQRPDLFRRAHLALVNEISCVIPIEVIHSIDEMAAKLDKRDAANPEDLAARIKKRIKDNIGGCITCSIGFAANRLLAKIACKLGKPDGVKIWHPSQMPSPLLDLDLSAIPGIGRRMKARLERAEIFTVADLLNKPPARLRALWRNLNGERMWYALHGYAIHSVPTRRSMYGHGRVLSPEWRTFDKARDCSRLLLTKAAWRMRRNGFYARSVHLWLRGFDRGWFGSHPLSSVNDDHACLAGLSALWSQAAKEVAALRIIRCGVILSDLVPSTARQMSLLEQDDVQRLKWEKLTSVMDRLNTSHGHRVVSLGTWTPPPGGYAGGKIAFTRIPSAEDFL